MTKAIISITSTSTLFSEMRRVLRAMLISGTDTFKNTHSLASHHLQDTLFILV